MPKHPKPTAEPSTASNRLTPQEIDALRESAHRMDAEMRAILAVRKNRSERRSAHRLWRGCLKPNPPDFTGLKVSRLPAKC
jgi:hypothetical protein